MFAFLQSYVALLLVRFGLKSESIELGAVFFWDQTCMDFKATERLADFTLV